MSHFSRIKTKITDLNALAQALQELDFQGIKRAEDNSLVIHGVGSHSYGQIVAHGEFQVQHWGTRQTNTILRTFGFSKEADGTFSLHVDPWSLPATFEADLQAKIQQKYAAVVAKNNLMEQGFVLTEEVTEDGEIHMTLVRV
jgi:hypothetical protein